MRKIVLGQTPKNFKRLVTVTLPDGEETNMEVLFKYRTRTKLAEFMAEITKDQEKPTIDLDIKDIAGSTFKSIETDADTLMQVIDGWNLEHEFNRENVVQFCDELPQAAFEILQQYFFDNKSVRLGN